MVRILLRARRRPSASAYNRTVTPQSPTSADRNDPHKGVVIHHLGPEPADARLSVILLHGRGASAADILGLADEFGLDDIAYLAPEAAGREWYPRTFLAPIDQNEPNLSSAIHLVATLVATLGEAGVDADRVGLIGFSQGACLSLEFVVRHPRRYAVVGALSGGLIGPPGSSWPDSGALDGTPVFLGCSDVDPHIPLARVRESADIFRRRGADVDERIYPRMGHTVNRDELDALRALLAPSVEPR
jgi:predicted esterase